MLGGNVLPNGDPIIDDSSSGTNYFARGHLSPDAAFIEGAEQDATYFFFNVAPQFQSFNNVCFTQNNTIYNVHIFRSNFLNILQGNWVALEKATRVLAEE